jgi:hypothetical protein
MSWPSQPDLVVYSNNLEYNQFLDDRNEPNPISVEASEFRPSRVLFELERQTYEAVYTDYLQQQREIFRDTVLFEFPRLVALHYFRFLNAHLDDLHRLLSLRDTWEALINLIHAFVVSDFRCNHIPIPRNPNSNRHLDFYSDSLFEKLANIECLINHATVKNLNLVCVNAIPAQTIQDMIDLNRQRNGFSHCELLSDPQALQVINDTEENVLDLLHDLRALQDIHLIRYRGQVGNALELRCESFDGHNLERRLQTITITPALFGTAAGYLQDTHILATNNQWILSLRPFIHFQEDASGHYTRLCMLKREGPGGPNATYEYEVNGEAISVQLPRAYFSTETAELINLRIP